MNFSATFTDGAIFAANTPLEPLGPFYFAWADALEPFNPAVHAKNDDEIFEFEIDQSEGDFATLRMQVRNPRIGLLAPGRKIWAWFSFWNGTELVPLFYGRIVGVPEQLQDELVELNFIARPDDFAVQKDAAAAAMREYGQWDPIWFSADTANNADNVLEASASLWNIDRITHQVTLTAIANGEDGTLNYAEDDVFYDGVSLTYAQNPIRAVTMTADVSWQQQAAGTVDITHHRVEGLDHAGTIISRTGGGLVDNWPKTGTNIGGGWTFVKSEVSVQFGPIDPAIVGDWGVNTGTNQSFYFDGGFDTSLGTFGVQLPGQPIGWAYHVAIPLWGFTYQMQLGYTADRRKQEMLSFTLEADVQPTLTEPEDEEALVLTMSSSEIVAQGAIPADARSYFSTPRGTQSVEYLIAVARSHLIARARAVNLNFDVPFRLAVADELSCRKNAICFDRRLPGGFAAGKIIRYTLSMADGKPNATIYIGCMVGRGGIAEALEGQPIYVDADYVGDDYQFYDGKFILPGEGDVAYQSIEGLAPNDDGVDFSRMTPDSVVKRMRIIDNFTGSQEAALSLFDITVSDAGQESAVNTTFARMHLELVDLTGGPFETDYIVPVSNLKIPKTIDLEAGAYE